LLGTSGLGSNGFDDTVLTIQSDGSFTNVCNATSYPSCGGSGGPGSVSISSAGLITIPQSAGEVNSFVMGASKDVMVQLYRGDLDGNTSTHEEQELIVGVKKADW